MSSPSITSFFTARKRAATDDIISSRHKLSRLEAPTPSSDRAKTLLERAISTSSKANLAEASPATPSIASTAKVAEKPIATERVTRASKRSTATSANAGSKQQKIVKFTLGGSLSPRKNAAASPSKVFKAVAKNADTATPTEQKPDEESKLSTPTSSKNKPAIVQRNLSAKKQLTFDDIKSKIGRSGRLGELKSSLNKIQQLQDQYKACIDKRTAKIKANSPVKLDGQSLKQFDTIELEVLSSPQKGLRTPTKTPVKTPCKIRDSADKDAAGGNELMSPKKAVTPRCLFSPSKANSVPAYERFNKERTNTPLALPYKYQSLWKTFRYVDWVCSMFYNRKETITFDKLEPAVKRMMRKDFTRDHLAKIKYLDPDAFVFEQRKMINPGSHTKFERYHMIITPHIEPSHLDQAADNTGTRKLDDEDVVRNADTKTMNPKILTLRSQQFQSILLDRVKHEHDQFLRSLQPPVVIPKEKIQRWHQDFELEACPDILSADLPQPPNIERFSSAKDILSTARNLFNGYDENTSGVGTPTVSSQSQPVNEPPPTPTISAEEDARDKLLKNIPKALRDKIKAKQAAKQLEAMTRRPSQEAEASKFARLPDLVRYIRNIFVTENKRVMELDKVMAKLGNSFREKMPREKLRELLELMAKEAPRNWLSFQFHQNTDYIRINRDENLNDIVNELERKAKAKFETFGC